MRTRRLALPALALALAAAAVPVAACGASQTEAAVQVAPTTAFVTIPPVTIAPDPVTVTAMPSPTTVIKSVPVPVTETETVTEDAPPPVTETVQLPSANDGGYAACVIEQFNKLSDAYSQQLAAYMGWPMAAEKGYADEPSILAKAKEMSDTATADAQAAQNAAVGCADKTRDR